MAVSVNYPNDYVYFIVDNRSKYATVMTRNIMDLTIREIAGIDIKGKYFSTKELAEKEVKYSK